MRNREVAGSNPAGGIVIISMNHKDKISEIIERDKELSNKEKEIIKEFIMYRVRNGISQIRVIRMYRLLKMIKEIN